MDDATVLADALVEAGIGRKAVHGGMPHYSTDTVSPLDSVVWVRADEFINELSDTLAEQPTLKST